MAPPVPPPPSPPATPMVRSPLRQPLLWSIVVPFGALLGLAPAASAFPPDSAVLSLLKQRVADERGAGRVVGLRDPDRSTRVLAWGDPGPGQPRLHGNPVFEIGSIPKVFTAALLSDIARRGEVALDDP